MSFDKSLKALGICFFVLLFSSCGIFGKKSEPSLTVVSPGTDLGCFDELGNRLTAYFDGKISEAEWTSTFDCVDSALVTFEQRVRGEFSSGYSEGDIRALLTQFLIRTKPVKQPFIDGLFAMKTSLFGGDPKIIEKTWIKEIRSMVGIIRDHSTRNIGLFRNRAIKKSPDTGLELVQAAEALGLALGNFFSKFTGTLPVPKNVFLAFLSESLNLADIREGWVSEYGDLILAGASLFSRSEPTAVSEKAWSALFGTGVGLGVAGYVYSERENYDFVFDDSKHQFYAALLRIGSGIFKRLTDVYGGTIPTERLSLLISVLPESIISQDRRSAVLTDLPRILSRTVRMGLGFPEGLSQPLFEYWVKSFDRAAAVMSQVRKVFDGEPDLIEKSRFQARMNQLLPGTKESEKGFLREAGLLANRYIGLYGVKGSLMKIGNRHENTVSFTQIEHFFWYREIVSFLLDRYLKPAIVPGAERLAKLEDLEAIVQDVLTIMRGWKKAHPLFDAKQLAAKRFREANLFMPSSNGDDSLDEKELAYYLAFLYSSGQLSNQIFSTLKDEKLCDDSLLDELRTPAFTPSCFRANYFSHPELFLSNLPGLSKFLAGLTGEAAVAVPKAIESAARRNGYTEEPLGLYDIDSISGLHHYVESLFNRFDISRDERLSKDEILNLAFPIFKRELATLAGVNKEWILKPTLTYLIYYGRKPSTTDLLWWIGYSEALTIRATRANIYNLLALISAETSEK